MKKIASILTLVLLISSLAIVIPASAELPPELEEDVEEAIALGVSWIASQQNGFGSWTNPLYTDYTAAYTAFALIKLQDYAYEIGLSPFDPAYEYYDNVIAGWNWVFELDPASGIPKHVFKKPIGLQDHTLGASGTMDDPDVRDNEYGLVFGTSDHRYTYSTGIILMALEASGEPTRSTGYDFDGDGTPDSFFDVCQDAVDWLAFAQGDTGHDEGGWFYTSNSAGTPVEYESNPSSSADTDNSNGGFAVLGLAAAEGFGCTVPEWVKTELNVWIDVMQDPVDGDLDDGGSWYRPEWTWINEYKTGNLIFEMTFVGDAPTSTRFMDAMDYIERHWNDANQDPGWGIGGVTSSYIAMYTLMKGFEYSQIDLIDLDGDDVPEHDWFLEFATELVNEQVLPDGYWSGGLWGDDLANTFWALLVLEKITPPPPIIEVSVDVKPGSWPNPFNKDAKGVFSVAICGTEEFDVTTIDPASVMLYFEVVEEGDYASPLRWTYEDVATPYMPPNPDTAEGHEMEGDGYMDLVFKFSRVEVTGLMTCEEEDMSDWKLWLTGNLKEEEGGTAIEGFDWIRIQMSKGKK
jgi:hypothetical protein